MQVILNLEIGGAQEVVRTLAKYQALAGCMLIVCTFQDGPLRRDIEALGIKVELLPPRRHSVIAFPWFVADLVRIWGTLVKLVKKYDINVVQTHLLTTLDFLVLLLRYTTSVRVVLWSFHNSKFVLPEGQASDNRWLITIKQNAHRLLYRLASHWVSGFIAVSDQVKVALVENIGPIQNKIVVICNGVDIQNSVCPVDKISVRNKLGLDPHAKVIAMVSTLRIAKGHRYMLQAMTAILHEHPAAHVLFIGDGSLKEDLKAQAATLGMDSHIHFLGSRRDVPELLAASDLFVLPSLWEGLSMSLLEAMAAGLPVVASEVSGTVQVVLPGVTGLLVPPGNVPALAQAVIQLLSNPAQAHAFGVAGRQRVEKSFSAAKQTDEHLILYRRLLERA